MGWLIPFALVAPAIRIGGYDMGAMDALVLILGAVSVLRGRKLSSRGSPIVPYVSLFFLGWLLATTNGLRFGVGFSVPDFIILYRLAFCFLAWRIGYRSLESMDRVATSRVAIMTIAAVVGIAILYSVLPHGERLRLISFFQPVDSNLERLCQQGRFPGIIENSNIYSFLPFCLLVFSFRSFMRRRASLLVPALSVVLIVALGSRITLLCAMIAVPVIFVFPSTNSLVPIGLIRAPGMTARNRALAGLAIFAVSLAVTELVSRGLIGERVMQKVEVGQSVDDVLYRHHKWAVGLHRVSLAPLLGIPKPRGPERGNLGYYFAMIHPHNELIQIWMWYGALGLLAHIYLLLSLLRGNLQYRMGATWYLFYAAVIFRMFFDTAFKSYHFSAVFFMVAGHNWRLLDGRAMLLSSHTHALWDRYGHYRKRSSP